jgi:putative methionine-R-sulfoxide reductase with GAF domain
VAAEQVLTPEGIVRALHGAFCRGASRYELLQMTATKIGEAGPPFDRVYVYLLAQDSLRLHAFAGEATEFDSMELHTGVQGQAVVQKQNVYVPNPATTGCTTHSNDTRSKLVVLIRCHDTIIGAVDVESDVPDAFSDLEQAAVSAVADGLAALL